MLNIDSNSWLNQNYEVIHIWIGHFKFISLNSILFYSKLFDKHPAPDDTYWMP